MTSTADFLRRTAREFRNGESPNRNGEAWPPIIPLAEAPTAEPFPLETLPHCLAEFVKAVALAQNCPPDYVAVPLLAIAGGAIGASRALQIKGGWRERPCLFAAVIGPPGSAKSPALKVVAAPVYGEQSRRKATYRDRRRYWEEENDKQGEPPKMETVYVADVTTEKLAAILQDNPRGVVMIRDELTGWIGSMDQYRAKGRGADRQAYLSIWAGEPIRVDRKGEQEPVYVPHPFVGIAGGLPPDLLPRLRGDKNISDGFLDRVLLSFPEPLPAKGEDWMEIDEYLTEAWKDALRRLWELQGERTDDGDPRPRYVRLTADGRREWESFTARLAREQNRDDLADAIKGHLAKYRGYCARLALIVHFLRIASDEVQDEDVDGESLARAGKLIDYFYSHCLKVHAALGSDEEIENALRVLDWIKREHAKEFKRHEVHNDVKSKSRFPKPEDLDKPLARLAKQIYIRERAATSGKSAGRKAEPIFEVNPAVFQDDQINQTNQTNSR